MKLGPNNGEYNDLTKWLFSFVNNDDDDDDGGGNSDLAGAEK